MSCWCDSPLPYTAVHVPGSSISLCCKLNVYAPSVQPLGEVVRWSNTCVHLFVVVVKPCSLPDTVCGGVAAVALLERWKG